MQLSLTYASVWLLNVIAPTIFLYRIFAPILSPEMNCQCRRSYGLILLCEFFLFAGLLQLSAVPYNWQGLKRLLFIYWPPFVCIGYYYLRPYFYQFIFSIGMIGMLMFAWHTILINLVILAAGSQALLHHILLYFVFAGLLQFCLLPVGLQLFHLIFYKYRLLKHLAFWRYFCWIPIFSTLYSIALAQSNLPLGHLYLQPRLLQIVAIIVIFLTLHLSVKQVQQTLHLKARTQNLLTYIDILSDYTQMLQGSQQRMRILRHDTRHQLLLLSSLLQQKDADSALVLLQHFSQGVQELSIWQERCSATCKKELQPLWQNLQQEQVSLSMDINLPHLPAALETHLLPIMKALLQAATATLQTAPKKQRSLIFIAHQTKQDILISLRNNCPILLHFDEHNLPTDAPYASITALLQEFNTHYPATYQYNQEPGFVSFHLRISCISKGGGLPT